jgi:hypothetical protein
MNKMKNMLEDKAMGLLITTALDRKGRVINYPALLIIMFFSHDMKPTSACRR